MATRSTVSAWSVRGRKLAEVEPHVLDDPLNESVAEDVLPRRCLSGENKLSKQRYVGFGLTVPIHNKVAQHGHVLDRMRRRQ
jgi:hypothetical protein